MKPGVNTVDFSPYVQEIIANKMVRHNSYSYAYCSPRTINITPRQTATLTHGFLSLGMCSLLLNHIRQHDWLPVGDDGFANKAYDEVGSYRLSNYNPEWADAIWQNLINKGMSIEPQEFDELDKVDRDGHALWRPIGLNPLFRFIRYKGEGKLVAHYDAPYIESPTVRSMKTVVIYLTGGGDERVTRGSTRFIKDPQALLSVDSMDLSDWNRCAHPEEVSNYVFPSMGSALVFDHRILHDSEPLASSDSEKIIIRTDVMFEKVV